MVVFSSWQNLIHTFESCKFFILFSDFSKVSPNLILEFIFDLMIRYLMLLLVCGLSILIILSKIFDFSQLCLVTYILALLFVSPVKHVRHKGFFFFFVVFRVITLLVSDRHLLKGCINFIQTS